MNPGYMASLCLFILCVLYWMGSLEAVRKVFRLVILFFTAALLAGLWDIPVSPFLSINASFFVAFVLFFYMWSREEESQRTQLFMSGLLIGVSMFLLQYLLYLDPVLQVAGPLYCEAAASLALTVILARTLPEAVMVSIFGTLVLEVCNGAWQYTSSGAASFGGMAFLDILFLSSLLSASAKAIILSLYGHASGIFKGLMHHKKQKRAGR